MNTRSMAPRLMIAVPSGLVLGFVVWLLAAAGVHAYDAPRVQWLLIFPAALLEGAALPVHAVQWVCYGFLLVSVVARESRRRFSRVALAVLVGHVLLGLATYRPHAW